MVVERILELWFGLALITATIITGILAAPLPWPLGCCVMGAYFLGRATVGRRR